MEDTSKNISGNGNSNGVVELRLRNLETCADKRDIKIEELEDTIITLRETVARLSERVTLFQIFQATLSAILSGIATALARLP